MLSIVLAILPNVERIIGQLARGERFDLLAERSLSTKVRFGN